MRMVTCMSPSIRPDLLFKFLRVRRRQTHDMKQFGLIVPENFIQATRDSGYKSLASAIAELVDNAFESEADRVDITLAKDESLASGDVRVVIADNGKGMDARTLRHSLQFGWSSRFNQRNSFGRYGMGLPNASLSQARRVQIWTSIDGRRSLMSYLDIDEVLKEGSTISSPIRVSMSEFLRLTTYRRGTVIVWQNCDRLKNLSIGPLCKKLHRELGRIFRYQIWAGKKIMVNSEILKTSDPLFLETSLADSSAHVYGTDLTFEVEVPDSSANQTSCVTVRFSELPIRHWHHLPNKEKSAKGITKNAGVSIVRAGREIDVGWFFMGQKRKENYDDWWRCEVKFAPVLDELFGVTHNKQEIHPTELLLGILAPDMERIARELNLRARQAFLEVKSDSVTRRSETVAERLDNLLEPPSHIKSSRDLRRNLKRGGRGRVGGLEYRFIFEKLQCSSLYEPQRQGNRVTVVLNTNHPLASFLIDSSMRSRQQDRRNIELLILAAARAELIITQHQKAKTWIKNFRQSWSMTLAAFLG